MIMKLALFSLMIFLGLIGFGVLFFAPMKKAAK